MKQAIENLQRPVTKIVPEIKNLSYEDKIISFSWRISIKIGNK